jgi:SnoaL-like protein
VAAVPDGGGRQPGSNLEIIFSDWLDAIRTGDIARLAARITPETTHRGVRPELICENGAEVIANARGTSEQPPQVEAVELISSGDDVVLGVRSPDIGRPGIEELQGQVYLVFTLRDGRIIEIRDYLTRAEALAAAGAAGRPDWR